MNYVNNGKIELNTSSRSYTSIDVLPFLTGRKIDKVVMGYLHALRPSYIQVSKGGFLMNAIAWRVSILLDDNDKIKWIRQEVEVGLYEGVENGYELRILVGEWELNKELP